ncbi:MAG: hypothetical protein IPL46_04265 [Saprospiraceae bacterium]|nr:hypothetical protein [Saprospiraceae bacterium]
MMQPFSQFLFLLIPCLAGLLCAKAASATERHGRQELDGPNRDIYYPDDGMPCSNCCGAANCNNSEPYLVIGAEKHDAGAQYPFYNGIWMN